MVRNRSWCLAAGAHDLQQRKFMRSWIACVKARLRRTLKLPCAICANDHRSRISFHALLLKFLAHSGDNTDVGRASFVR